MSQNAKAEPGQDWKAVQPLLWKELRRFHPSGVTGTRHRRDRDTTQIDARSSETDIAVCLI